MYLSVSVRQPVCPHNNRKIAYQKLIELGVLCYTVALRCALRMIRFRRSLALTFDLDSYFRTFQYFTCGIPQFCAVWEKHGICKDEEPINNVQKCELPVVFFGLLREGDGKNRGLGNSSHQRLKNF